MWEGSSEIPPNYNYRPPSGEAQNRYDIERLEKQLLSNRYGLERPEKVSLKVTNVLRSVNSISRSSMPYRFHVANSLSFTRSAFCVFRDALGHIDSAFLDLRTL